VHHETRLTPAGAVVAVLGGTASLLGARAEWQELPLPEIGVTYTHPSIQRNCDLGAANSLRKTYHSPGVRRRAQMQLAAMRAADVDSIRILMWHLSDPASGDEQPDR
jgi:hypothetical protein